MTLFLVIAVAMAAVALAWVLPVLLRRRDIAVVVQTRASNLAILKDQLAELEQDVAAGTLPQAQYQQAREDLERRAYEEAREPVAPVAVALCTRAADSHRARGAIAAMRRGAVLAVRHA